MSNVRLVDFYGRPARLIMNEADAPERCEIYDSGAGAFVERDDLTLDVLDSYGSRLIAEDEFAALLAKQARTSE